ncbi:MAG: class II aldolase/adducin family protein [Deltaproteobacteria bacterium]|nr:class II aldolase/adducin family protein [Deltaproteobacteria bacterium]
MRHRLLRAEIIETARRMQVVGLNQGTSGNLSVRVDDRFLVTPSGVPYDLMQEDEIVEMRLDGQVVGEGTPSTEWRIHRDILACRADVDVVLHAHPMFATALACLRREIPAFHYMVAVAGGDSIRCAPYARFGTQALSDLAVQALAGRRACLLANHGLLTLATTLRAALALAVEVETLAGQYLRTLEVGEPNLLSATEMDEVLEAFAGYGQPSRRRKAY